MFTDQVCLGSNCITCQTSDAHKIETVGNNYFDIITSRVVAVRPFKGLQNFTKNNKCRLRHWVLCSSLTVFTFKWECAQANLSGVTCLSYPPAVCVCSWGRGWSGTSGSRPAWQTGPSSKGPRPSCRTSTLSCSLENKTHAIFLCTVSWKV